MEASGAGRLFMPLGIVFGLLGVGLCGIVETRAYSIFDYSYDLTYNPHIFTGSILIGIGVNWFIVGVIFVLADREVTTQGLLSAFFLGVFGVILWLIFCNGGKACFSLFNSRTEDPHMHCSNCGLAVPIVDSTQFCPYCGKKLRQKDEKNEKLQ